MDTGQHLLPYAAVGPAGHPHVQVLDTALLQLVDHFSRLVECGQRNHRFDRKAQLRYFFVNRADQFHIHRNVLAGCLGPEFRIAPQVLPVQVGQVHIAVAVGKQVPLDRRIIRDRLLVHVQQ